MGRVLVLVETNGLSVEAVPPILSGLLRPTCDTLIKYVLRRVQEIYRVNAKYYLEFVKLQRRLLLVALNFEIFIKSNISMKRLSNRVHT